MLNLTVKSILLPFILGIISSFGFPSHLKIDPSMTLSLVAWILMAILVRTSRRVNKVIFLQFFFFTIGTYLNLFPWMHVGISNFNQAVPSLNLLIHTIYFLGQTLCFIAPAFLIIILRKAPPLMAIIIYPLSLTLLEILPTKLFPYDLGHIFINHHFLLSWLPISGVYFYSFFLYMLFALVVFHLNKKQLLYSFFSLILTIIAPYLFSFSNEKEIKSKPLIIRMSQTGPQVFNPFKEQNKNLEYTINFYNSTIKNFSQKLSAVDLHILPESFYPHDYFKPNQNKLYYGEQLGNFLFSAKNTLFGAIYREEVEDIEYRSGVIQAFHHNKTPRIIYKKKLVPLSEKFPFPKWLKSLNQGKPVERIFLSSIYKKSNSYFEMDNFNFATSFCWEILFSNFQQKELSHHPKVDFIVNVANESFFNHTNELELHLFMTRMRSIELNIPIFKVTRTGYSAYIKNGKVEQLIDKNKVKYLDITFHKQRSPKTLYYQYGLLATLFGILVQIIVILISGILNKKSHLKK